MAGAAGAGGRLARGWRSVAAEGGHTFTVVQFNALAKSLCTRDSFPYASAEALEWEERKTALSDEVLFAEADVIGMEEVDQESYEGHFRALLSAEGYGSAFSKKPSSHSRDGCLAAWREATFLQRAAATPLRYGDGNQLALLVSLQHRASGRRLLVAVTHLKAKLGFEEQRRQQAALLVEALAARAADWDEAVVCGDFNDEPSSASYRLMASQAAVPLSSCYAAYPLAAEEAQAQPSTPGVRLTAGEAPLTTLKQRQPEAVTCRTIDYIWTSSGLCVAALLALPWPPPSVPFPSALYPSDHILIGAKLSFAS